MNETAGGTGAKGRGAIAASVLFALGVLGCGLTFGGQSDMPMLNWMGREKAVKRDKEVALKILRENRDLSYRAGLALATGSFGVSE